MDYIFLAFVLAIFIAVVLLTEGAFHGWNSSRGPAAKRIAKRLEGMSSHDPRQANVSIRKRRVFSESSSLQMLLQRTPHVRKIDLLLEQSGLKLNLARFLLLSAGCGAAALFVLLLLPLPLPAVIPFLLGVVAAGIPTLIVMTRRRQRLRRIEAQLPDALDLISRALRAGHALPAAIKMVGDELSDPLASEFRSVFDEVNFGISMPEALNNLSSRVPGTDVGYFVVAVLIQRETGGNLTELLGNISRIVRERLKLSGQIRVFSAEGRLSAWILGILPFALAAVLQTVNPKFMNLLWTDPLGHKMLGAVAVLMVIGVFWMRKVIRIRV
jgi:tight adherence protein B